MTSQLQDPPQRRTGHRPVFTGTVGMTKFLELFLFAHR